MAEPTGSWRTSSEGIATEELLGRASRQALQGELITGQQSAPEKRLCEVLTHAEQEKLDTPKRLLKGKEPHCPEVAVPD